MLLDRMVKAAKKEPPTPRRRASFQKARGGIAKVLSRPVSSVPTSANIKVIVRVRPPNSKEQDENTKTVIKVIDEQMLIFDPKEEEQGFFYHGVQQRGRDLLKRVQKDISFCFDRVFGNNSTNIEVFHNSTQSLIDTLMDGINCSVFAYGATGAGKTFTMIGSTETPGITYLTMKDLFKRKAELSAERDFELMLTYIEVYNELVKDLLNPGPPLNLREDSKYGVMIPGVKGHKFTSPEELFALLEQGNKRRTQHPTDANAESSRSHAVFQVYIQMTVKTTREVRRAKLSMIDLAGSERGSATGFVGARFKEGANINKSLLALGNCINSLADGQRHVPYRDSKLTRLLKDSLGGNCHTIMIANVSPSSLTFDDTYNTLKYATRAKNIKSNIKRNIVNADLNADQYIKLVEDLQSENTAVKSENTTLKSENANLKTENEQLKNEIDKLQVQLTLAQADIQQISVQNVCNSSITINQTSEQKATVTSTITEEPELDKNLVIQLNTLLQEKKEILERKYQLESVELGMALRRQLKQEINSRLSDLYRNTPEKDDVHRKLAGQIDRFQKREEVTRRELEKIDKSKEEVTEKISRLVAEHPKLNEKAHALQLEMETVDYKYKTDLAQKEVKILLDDHKNKSVLLENVTVLLRTMWLNLQSRGNVPKSIIDKYQELVAEFQGRRNTCFEEVTDSGVSSSTSLFDPVSSDEALQSNKRKIEELGSNASLDSTFVKENKPVVSEFLSPRLKRNDKAATGSSTQQIVARGATFRPPTKRLATAKSPKRPLIPKTTNEKAHMDNVRRIELAGRISKPTIKSARSRPPPFRR